MRNRSAVRTTNQTSARAATLKTALPATTTNKDL